MKSVFSKLVVLSLLAFAGCAPTARVPLFVCPERGGGAWTEVASAHFSLKTDLDRVEAEEVSANLEAMLAAISAVGFASPDVPSIRSEVVYFRRTEEGLALTPRAQGAFFWSGLYDFERTPITMLHGAFAGPTKRTLQHELTHLLVHYFYPQAPAWLNEGLAEYYSTLEFDRVSATLGRVTPRRRFWNGHWTATGPAIGGTIFIPVGEAPPASELMKVDVSEFYGAPESDANTWEAVDAKKAPTLRYAAAFSLVRLLLTHRDYRAAFADYLQGLHAGQTHAAAWQKTVGVLGEPKLDADYQSSLILGEEAAFHLPFSPPKKRPWRSRAMSDAEVHVLWARMRGAKTLEDRGATLADLDEASRRDPRLVDVALVRAALALDDGYLETAENALKVGVEPPSARVLNAIGWVRVETFARAKKPNASDFVKALEPIVAKLEPIATTAAELDLIARERAAKGNLDEGIAFEKRAMAADPSCVSCLAASAGMLDAKGLVREALETATTALGLLPEGMSPGPLLRRIASYRRHLASAQGAVTPPTP